MNFRSLLRIVLTIASLFPVLTLSSWALELAMKSDCQHRWEHSGLRFKIESSICLVQIEGEKWVPGESVKFEIKK